MHQNGAGYLQTLYKFMQLADFWSSFASKTLMNSGNLRALALNEGQRKKNRKIMQDCKLLHSQYNICQFNVLGLLSQLLIQSLLTKLLTGQQNLFETMTQVDMGESNIHIIISSKFRWPVKIICDKWLYSWERRPKTLNRQILHCLCIICNFA